jgi:signal transduction histidine kinase
MSPDPFLPPFEDRPHVFGTLPAAFGVLAFALLPVFAGLLVSSVLSLMVRFRRADPSVRAQIKWLGLAGLSVPLTLLAGWAGYLLGHPDVVVVGLVVMNVAVPAVVTVAIVRQDLFDIDQLFSDGVRLTAIAGIVLAAYAATSGLLGLLLGGQSPIGVAAATVAAAVVLVPARRYVGAHLERRLYPARWRAEQAIQLLTMQTHAGTAEPEVLEARLRDALHDPGLQVGYLVPGSQEIYDHQGRALLVHENATPIERAGNRIGVLQPALPLRPRLARDVADSCALLVELVRLRLERAAALNDANVSRTRLLHAAYQERRRVVNDLHDGSQRRLVSLGVSLRIAQRHLDDGTVNVDDLIEVSVAELGAVVAELRQLANGLRPSCLDDGLDAALAQLASLLPLAVDLDLRAGDLSDEVSSTAYFVASEALTNAVKHSHANRLGLSAVQDQGTLRLTVSDNGGGGARVRTGHGLPGLQDRVAAHGGTLAISSPTGLGTLIDVLLPCAS